jgi:hypothetical protein
VRQLNADDKAPGASLDYYGDKLSIQSAPPKGGRRIAIRRY